MKLKGSIVSVTTDREALSIGLYFKCAKLQEAE